jgi:hypothetical protein
MQDAGVEYSVTKEFVYNIMMEGLVFDLNHCEKLKTLEIF